MPRLKITFFLAVAHASLLSLFASGAADELKEFRTVSTAKTTTIESTGVAAGGRPGYYHGSG